jgi:hypothetical protein
MNNATSRELLLLLLLLLLFGAMSVILAGALGLVTGGSGKGRGPAASMMACAADGNSSPFATK